MWVGGTSHVKYIYSSENNLNELILFTLCGTTGSKAGHIWQQGPHPLTQCEDPRKFPIPSNKYTTREQVLGGDMNSRGSLGSVWSRKWMCVDMRAISRTTTASGSGEQMASPPPHTYTHVVRLRGWQCVAHVWMLYIVYAEKYPTYSLKTAPLPRLAKPVSLTHSVCVYKSISCLSVYNKQYVTRWASGSAHYFSLLPAQLHSGISPAVLDMVVGEHMSGLERGQ